MCIAKLPSKRTWKFTFPSPIMKCTDKFKGKFHILHKPLKTFRGSLEGSIHSLHLNSSPCAFKALKVQLPAHLGEQGARGKGPLKPSSMGHTSLTMQPKPSWPNILSWGWKGENCAGLQHIFLFLDLVCTYCFLYFWLSHFYPHEFKCKYAYLNFPYFFPCIFVQQQIFIVVPFV